MVDRARVTFKSDVLILLDKGSNMISIEEVKSVIEKLVHVWCDLKMVPLVIRDPSLNPNLARRLKFIETNAAEADVGWW